MSCSSDGCLWILSHWFPEAEKSEDTAGGGWQGALQRNYSQDCSFKDNMYHVGDYVYVEPTEANLQPHIVCIERLWQDDAGIASLKPYI